jgi:hypothetical protein
VARLGRSSPLLEVVVELRRSQAWVVDVGGKKSDGPKVEKEQRVLYM